MKKTKLTYFFGVIAFGSAMVAHAAPVSEELARTVASGFLEKSSFAKQILEGRSVAQIEQRDTVYIAHLAPSGHIILAGTTKCAPVLSFSSEDFVEPLPDTPNLDMFESWLELSAEKESDATLEENAEWTKYAQKTSTRRRLLAAASDDPPGVIVPPMLGAAWHQGSPYNDFSPFRIVCGCMATAGGQEHRYWRWPYFIPKFRTITHGLTGYPNQTIRYNGFVPFDYDLIYGSYEGGETPEKTGTDELGNSVKKARYEAAYLTHWMQSMVKMSFKPGAAGGIQKLCNEAIEIYFV